MGEWSEAVEDGAVCASCFLPFDVKDMVLPEPRVCENCADEPSEHHLRPGTRHNPFGRRLPAP